jgi:hypothetical protein
MNKLDIFLEGLRVQLAAIRNENPDNLADWYRVTNNLFKNYHGVNHPTTMAFAGLVKNYISQAFLTPFTQVDAFEVEERQKAVDFIESLLVFYPKSETHMSSGAGQTGSSVGRPLRRPRDFLLSVVNCIYKHLPFIASR